MTWKLSVPLVVVLYLVFVILKLPAARVVGVLEVPPDSLSYQPLQGTWLAGESDSVWLGAFPLGQVSWRMKPAALLWGCLEYQVQFDSSVSQRGTGRVGRCIGSRTYVQDVEAKVRARDLGILASNGLLAVGGQVDLNVATLRRGAETFREAQGAMLWQTAVIEGPNRLGLGSVTVDLALQDGGLAGRLSNQGGEVGLTGNVTLDAAGRYQLDLRLGAQAGRQPPAWIGSVASRQRDGTYLLRHAGQL